MKTYSTGNMENVRELAKCVSTSGNFYKTCDHGNGTEQKNIQNMVNKKLRERFKRNQINKNILEMEDLVKQSLELVIMPFHSLLI